MADCAMASLARNAMSRCVGSPIEQGNASTIDASSSEALKSVTYPEMAVLRGAGIFDFHCCQLFETAVARWFCIVAAGNCNGKSGCYFLGCFGIVNAYRKRVLWRIHFFSMYIVVNMAATAKNSHDSRCDCGLL